MKIYSALVLFVLCLHFNRICLNLFVSFFLGDEFTTQTMSPKIREKAVKAVERVPVEIKDHNDNCGSRTEEADTLTGILVVDSPNHLAKA